MTCYLEWIPHPTEGLGGAKLHMHYLRSGADATAGLYHQLVSLACALGEAAQLGRTLVLSHEICMDPAHALATSQHKPVILSGGAGVSERIRSASQAQLCMPFDRLLDMELIRRLVPISTNGSAAIYGATKAPELSVANSTAQAQDAWPCTPGAPRLLRRRTPSFWFQECAKARVNTGALARRLHDLIYPPGAHLSVPGGLHWSKAGPSADSTFAAMWRRTTNGGLRFFLLSGIFAAPHLKRASTAVRDQLGARYAAVHVRRGDQLQENQGSDRSTESEAILRSLRLWFAPGVSLFVYSDEPSSYFAPLRDGFAVHFVQDSLPNLGRLHNYEVSSRRRDISALGALPYLVRCVSVSSAFSLRPSSPTGPWRTSTRSPTTIRDSLGRASRATPP